MCILAQRRLGKTSTTSRAKACVVATCVIELRIHGVEMGEFFFSGSWQNWSEFVMAIDMEGS